MNDENGNLPCPFCGGKCDPTGWMGCGEPGTPMRQGPECEGCGATTETLEVWNTRTPVTANGQ
jgi:hypothetical protein